MIALLNFLNLSHFHAFQNGDLGWFGTPSPHAWKNPMWMRGIGPWVFTLAPPLCLDNLSKGIIGEYWGRSWTWIASHGYSIYVW
jgi:hypothetical protein